MKRGFGGRALARRSPVVLSLGGVVVAAAVVARAGSLSAQPAPRPVVLHIGDSFTAAGFSQALRPKIEGSGRTYKVLYKTSAYTTTLPRDLGLLEIFAQYRPALTIITLGANEIPLADANLRRGAVRRLAEQASKHGPCVWTLPPVWRDDGNEILTVIREEAAPCKVYDVGALAKTIPRQKDKIHPTPEGGAIWADSFWKWLGDEPSLTLSPTAATKAP
jgi:hypothetical protein